MSTGRVLKLRKISRNVGELDRAVAFYRDALDFAPLHRRQVDSMPAGHAQIATLKLGEQYLELAQFDPPGQAYPRPRRSCDLIFQHLAVVVADMHAAYAQICRHGAEPISAGGPQTLPPNTGSVSAFKFRDPDGHPLELLQFGDGAAGARWRSQAGLFLGIDHTALVVDDLPQALAFYRGLGFRVAYRSHNQGREQQALDALPDAQVDVIGLQPLLPDPPWIELLAYAAAIPRQRGHCAHEAAANDIAADRLVLEMDRLAPANESGLRDPAGHRLLLQAGPASRPRRA